MGEIKPGEVRTAATTVEGVASSVRNHVPDEVGQIATALPGSSSGAAGSTLATTWTDAYAAWATSAETHAQSMRDAADAWTAANTTTADRFNRYGQTAI